MNINYGSVLALLVMIMPLLSSVGKQLDKPIALIVDDMTVAHDMQKSLSFGRRELTIKASESRQVVERVISAVGSVPGFFYYRRSSAAIKTIEYILDAYAAGEAYDRRVNGPVLVVFQEAIPSIYLEDFYVLRVDREFINHHAPEELILDSKAVPTALNKANEAMCQDDGLVGVLKGLKEFLPETMSDLQTSSFENCINSLIDRIEMPEDSEAIGEAFIRSLYAWIESKDTKLWKLSRISSAAESRITKDVFLSGECLYMSEDLFGKIIDPLKDVESSRQIKRDLWKSGLLAKSADGKYVFQMHYTVNEGSERLKRMVKFPNANALNLKNKPTLLEILRGGDAYEHDTTW